MCRGVHSVTCLYVYWHCALQCAITEFICDVITVIHLYYQTDPCKSSEAVTKTLDVGMKLTTTEWSAELCQRRYVHRRGPQRRPWRRRIEANRVSCMVTERQAAQTHRRSEVHDRSPADAAPPVTTQSCQYANSLRQNLDIGQRPNPPLLWSIQGLHWIWMNHRPSQLPWTDFRTNFPNSVLLSFTVHYCSMICIRP